MPIESLLALDVGGGTRDLFIWRRGQVVENAVKMVLPSPTRVAAARLARARAQGRDVFLSGWLMGGGAITRAAKENLAAGLKVWATPAVAVTFADDPVKVQAMGIQITEQAPAEALAIPTGDLDLEDIKETCRRFEVPFPEQLAVAVCDHGYSPGYSNRKFRFNQWRAVLEAGGRLTDLITDSPAEHLTRMEAIRAQAPGVLLMDTAAAALWGALQDPAVADMAGGDICVINLGNMHTVAFLLSGGDLVGIYEHHTRRLDQPRLADQVTRFISGALGDQEVFDDNGHGCARVAGAPTRINGPVILTGPRRRLAEGLGWRVASPLGDVMLSGCFGLVAAARAASGEVDAGWF